MSKFLSGGVGLAVNLIGIFWLAIAGGFAVGWYDRLTTTPSLNVPILFWHLTIEPPSKLRPLGVQLAGDQTTIRTLTSDVSNLSGALNHQNAAVISLASRSAEWQARSRAAVATATRANAGREVLAHQILTQKPPPLGADALAVCKAADDYLLEGAQ